MSVPCWHVHQLTQDAPDLQLPRKKTRDTFLLDVWVCFLLARGMFLVKHWRTKIVVPPPRLPNPRKVGYFMSEAIEASCLWVYCLINQWSPRQGKHRLLNLNIAFQKWFLQEITFLPIIQEQLQTQPHLFLRLSGSMNVQTFPGARWQ